MEDGLIPVEHSQDVVLLGSTGSIGTQTLEIVRGHREHYRVVALGAAGYHLEVLAQQICEFHPERVALTIPGASGRLKEILKSYVKTRAFPFPTITEGPDANESIAGGYPDSIVVNGMCGGVALPATLAALRCGATLALANKESLVVGGSLVREAMVRPGQIVPIDSEHCAIAQCLASGIHEKGLTSPTVSGRSDVLELILTASGGPFRGYSRDDLERVTVDQALSHPTWSMGPVVTINSSTLVNKGLELIEAHLLFDVDPDSIVTVVHPQSIVHSMVTWNDGATVAQASPPDMHIPIAWALSHPTRLPNIGQPLRWDKSQAWQFEPVNDAVFPAITLARFAVNASATHPAVYNAGNEVLVDAFLNHRLPWTSIVDILSDLVTTYEGNNNPTIDDILQTERWAVARARELIEGRG